jgi:hypothetical protein
MTLKQINSTDHLMRDLAGEISREYLAVLVDWLRLRAISTV